MLPAGLTAQPVSARTAAVFRRIHPPAQTVATLLSGACSCDLVRPRDPDQREDERHLRTRYFRLGYTRDQIVRALERHRRHPDAARHSGAGADALAAFVAEHARNAGPTLYHLRFSLDVEFILPLGEMRPETRALREVRTQPEAWLPEGRPVLVVRQPLSP